MTINHLQEVLKQEADKSLYVLCKSVLGYKDLQPQPHAEICRFIQEIPFGEYSPIKFRLLLVPRDCFKTTIATVGYTLSLISKFPDITMLLSSEAHEKSISMLAEIKGHIENNPRYKQLYGDLKSDTLWKEGAIIISTRKRPNKTPTIATTGVEGSKTAFHYDVIIVDDPHSERNYRSPNMRKKVIDHISSLLPLLRPHGFLLVIGTRWHKSDAYNWIINSFPQLKVMIRSWKNKGKLYFPGKLTENFMKIQRDILTKAGNSKLFYAWYENNPISDELISIPNTWRKIENFVYIPVNWDFGHIYRNTGQPDEEKRFVRICGVVDPADSDTSSSDFTGVTIKGIDSEGKWWIFFARRYREKAFLVIKYIVELAKKYKVATWGVETTGGRGLYRHDLQNAFLTEQLFCKVYELKSGNRAKSDRIASLEPRFEAQTIYINASETDLIEELDYPEVDNDDVIDSLAYHNLMVVEPPILKLETEMLDDSDPYLKHPKERKLNLSSFAGRDSVTGY